MEIKINDDGTVLIDGVVYVNDNPLFYPKKGDGYTWLEAGAEQFLIAAMGDIARKDVAVVSLRPETAERVAWGMSRLAEWQAMGVGIGEDGERRWFIDYNGETEYGLGCRIKSTCDALFLTEEDAETALEKFGGLEALDEARLARWGK